MRHQMLQMMGERLALLVGLSGADAIGQGDIAQETLGTMGRREGQDIGWLVLFAEPPVQVANRFVVGEQQGDALGVGRLAGQRGFGGDARERLSVRQGRRPGGVLDLYVDHVFGAVLAASAS